MLGPDKYDPGVSNALIGITEIRDHFVERGVKLRQDITSEERRRGFYLENKGGMSKVAILAPPVLGSNTFAMLAKRSPRRSGFATYSSMLQCQLAAQDGGRNSSPCRETSFLVTDHSVSGQGDDGGPADVLRCFVFSDQTCSLHTAHDGHGNVH